MTALPRSGDPAILAAGATSPRRRAGRAGSTRRAALGSLLLVVLLVVAACGVGRADDGADAGAAGPDDAIEARREIFLDVTWGEIDRRLDDLVAARDLPGGAVVVRPAAGDGHLHVSGALDLDEPVPLAETSTWLTTTVLLTLVDDGTLALDEPVGAHLPWLPPPAADITLRQLLSHTSGLPASVECGEPTPAACDAAIAAAALVDAPGEAFSVTELDQHLAARLAESATGSAWSDLVEERISSPVGLSATTYADPGTTGGLLAVDATATPNDLGRFLAMIRDGGRSGDAVVLSPASVQAMLLDQTVRLDTHTEPWVAETGVPTYGLGVWRDRLRGAEEASVVSAPNRWGLYPFVDDARHAWGIVVVDDHTSPRAEAVSGSAVLSQLSVAVLRRSEGG